MRYQLFGYSLVLAATVGCGGDDGPGVIVPDAKVFMDAAVDAAPLCTVTCEANICDGQNGSPAPGGTMFPALILAAGGTQQNPTPIDAEVIFVNDEMGSPLEGRTVLEFGGKLGEQNGLGDYMIVRVVKPTAGNFPVGTAVPFNSDPNVAIPDTVLGQAFFLGDAPAQGNPAQLYWASDGSITLNAVGEAVGDLINGEVTATNFREVDLSSGADVTGGCTSSVGGLQFYYKQAAPMPLQGSKSAPVGGNVLTPLTAEEWDYVHRTLGRLR